MLSEQEDYPVINVLSQRVHISQKDRKCEICKCTIFKGQKYMEMAQLEDGKFQRWIAHDSWQHCYSNIVTGAR